MFNFPKFLKTNYLSAVQLIVVFYAAATIISMIILGLPFFHDEGVELSFTNLLFTAVSAISVTGLTVVSTVDTFNAAGAFALAFVLQFGGIGIMTLGTFIWILLGKRIGLRERQLIQIDQNRTALSGLVRLMVRILKTILLIELVGTIILSTYFLNYFDTWQEAWLQGFFAAVSATTNAGFDITGASLIPFADDYFVQSVNIVLLILGAIGFPVLIETQDFLKGEWDADRANNSFSLFTQLTVITFFGLIVVGTVLMLILEQDAFLDDMAWHKQLFYSLFQSVTTRNGGLATMDVNELTEPTLIVFCMLMFIGASPSSVGGGIRTTTFAIMLLAIYNFARGRSSIKVFRREVDTEDVIRSFIVITTAVMLCMTAIVILMVTEPFPLLPVAFEVFSAFGTTGLSMGITADLSPIGKYVIIFLMFVGRIGIFSFLFIVRGKVTRDKYHFPKEKVIIG
ncbi:TrkH family potassium uptake protein [Planococcus lenghuensis]|uniref:Ktr system potassium uptake protein D n=1 Tax=Planococcus lenghuensis TaxID=2213202 RepID=A0A1Q2L2T7_9BACL|nr:TrkH family potassium uptake protein [Planococcus lenghuensis]AQQ54778.1 Ktr system potassium uptake protein D [Planococcus lenghuensis]